MSETDKLAKIVRHALIALGAVVIVTLVYEAATGDLLGRDDTDGPHRHSGLHLLTDYATGCQYLSAGLGGITPRADRTGKQLCEARP